MFNNTGSSHARRLGLVYGTKIIPNQLKSMIFPQAAPINDLHDMSEDVSTSELSTCETLATRTDVMRPLKAQASCMS